jgi:hypothetical protein
MFGKAAMGVEVGRESLCQRIRQAPETRKPLKPAGSGRAKFSLSVPTEKKKTNELGSLATWRARHDSNVRPLPSEGNTLSS